MKMLILSKVNFVRSCFKRIVGLLILAGSSTFASGDMPVKVRLVLQNLFEVYEKAFDSCDIAQIGSMLHEDFVFNTYVEYEGRVLDKMELDRKSFLTFLALPNGSCSSVASFDDLKIDIINEERCISSSVCTNLPLMDVECESRRVCFVDDGERMSVVSQLRFMSYKKASEVIEL